VTREGGTNLTKRAVIYDHGSKGGPKGLYSISGIKFTTSRKEAERLLRYILGKVNFNRKHRPNQTLTSASTCAEYDWMPQVEDTSWTIDLKTIIKNESVLHIDDLIYRRTSIGDNPVRVRALAERVANLFDWDDQRKQHELSNLLSRSE
jgi:glycerol-3-phosphate dehydrogenase